MADLTVVIVLALVVFVVLVLYQLTGLLGRTTHGEGPKYEAFAGGEALPSVRGKYHSELFVYAALFVAFEVVTLLVAGTVRLHSFLWPMLFIVAAGVSLSVLILWFIGMGGAELA
jgi:NADH:ubiquinone oxidoreductase subunit 3 (subunit A)